MEQANTFQDHTGKKPNNFLKIFVISVIIFLTFFAGYFYNEKYKEHNKKNYLENDETEVIEKKLLDSDIQVEWSERKKIEGFDFFNVEHSARRIEDRAYYYIGRIKEEKYQGWDLLMIATPCWSYYNCSSLPYVIGAKKGDDFIIFKNHSTVPEDAYNLEENYFTRELKFDSNYILKDLIYPEKITDLGEKIILNRVGRVFKSDWLKEDNLREIFFHEKYGQAYTDDHHGIYFKALDSTIVVYNLEVDFSISEIEWYDGDHKETIYENSDYHTDIMVGYYLDVVENIDIEKELKEVGINDKGDKIYFPLNLEHEILRSTYLAMGGYSPSDSREISYNEFLDGKPLFLWKDPFGRLIKFTNSEFITHAEMGKPVIYLYPEKEQEVWVEVSPIGGITISEPEHGRGWHVIANPDGELKEIKTGKIYPYLFWESDGELYEQPKKGFVIEQKKVREFLIDKLSLYAFNKKEIDDFLKFWLPLMEDYPYYFITFLETESMDKLAPLKVNPKPDTIIRILMDFSPLEKPIKVEKLNITPQQRRGFTLMEWGGIIRP